MSFWAFGHITQRPGWLKRWAALAPTAHAKPGNGKNQGVMLQDRSLMKSKETRFIDPRLSVHKRRQPKELKLSESNETWLLKLCTLPLVGEWASTIVGLLPIILFGVFQGVMGVEIGFGPWVMLALTVLMIPWLMYLERSQGVRMNLPYVPVRLLWLMPLLIIYCVSEIVGA